jgi:hypothetical protein
VTRRWARLGRAARRVLPIAAAALAAAFAGIPLATRLALGSRFLPRAVNADPSSLAVAWTSPRTWIPGRIHFDSLVVKSSDQNVQWEARLGDVTLDISLRHLLFRRFHATRVRAATLSFRLRERLSPEEAIPARWSRYPPIPGFSDPPLLEHDARETDGETGSPWRVLVDDLAVENVGEIWIDAWHWTGRGRLSGGFELLPGREALVHPAVLEIAGGELRRSPVAVTEATRGAVWAALPRFATQAYPGNDVWKLMSGGAALHGHLAGLDFLSPDSGGPRLTGGSGPVRVSIALRDGVGGLRVAASARRVRAHLGERRLVGTARAEIRIPHLDFLRGEALFSGTNVRLLDVAVDRSAPPAPWSGSLGVSQGHLTLSDGSMTMRLAGRFSDARPIVALLPSGPPKWVAGLLDLEDLVVSGGLDVAPGLVAVRSARAEAGSFSLKANWRSEAGRESGALLVEKGALSVGIGLQDGTSHLHLGKAREWFARTATPEQTRSSR